MSNLAHVWHFLKLSENSNVKIIRDNFLFCDTWKEQQRSDLDRSKHFSAIKNETEPYRVDLLHKRQISLISPRLKYRDILYFTTDKCEMTFN